jgi:uncharacterized OB-fold protein
LPIKERLDSVEDIVQWKDKIPLHYEYTAGPAGERFLRGLMDSKLVASRCMVCEISYMPPKAHCTNCFGNIHAFVDVGKKGKIAALSRYRSQGTKESDGRFYAYVKFQGVKGGLVHNILGKGARVGSKVVVRFMPRAKRMGSIRDIRGFEVVN